MVCTTIAAGRLFAADPADVVVTATRDRAESHRVPANVTVITSGDIAEAGYNNIVEALDDAGGLHFRSTSGNAAQSEIGMRGFGESSYGRVLVLVDGEKMNRPDMAGIDWLQIPLANIDRIEIVRGSNSAMYGDHAVSGVINIITKKGTKEREAFVSAQGGSFQTDAEQAAISGSKGKLLYSVNADHNQTDGYRDRSAYAAWGAAANLSCDMTDYLSSSLGASFDNLNYQLPGYLTKQQIAQDRRQSTNPNDSARNNCFNANAGVNAELGTIGRLGANVSFGRKDIRSDMTSWSSFMDLVIDTLGVTPRFTRDSMLFGRDNKLLVGVDYYLDKLSAKRFSDAGRTTQTVSADIKKTSLGIYARDEQALCDRLLLSAEARTETADINGKMSGVFDDKKSHDENAVDAALVRLIGEASKAFAKFGTVYRYPFVDEQISYFGFGSDKVYTDIEAEKGQNTEVGADLALTGKLRTSVTLFMLNMKDEIAYNAATSRNENLDKTRHRGVEARMSCAMVTNIAFDAGYTYTEATFREGENSGKTIPLVPANTVTVGSTFSLPYDLALRLSVRYTDASRLGGDYANTQEKLPGYTVTDLMLRYGPKNKKGLEVFAAVDNIFNETYSSLAYFNQYSGEIGYYPSPTRAYRAGLSYRF